MGIDPSAMRIAIDIDSTLHHYWDGSSPPRPSAASASTCPTRSSARGTIGRLRDEQLRAVVADTHADAADPRAIPYPGAVETVNAWHDAGHFIHVTSHRAGRCHAATARWLADIGLRYDELYCSYDKIARCVELGIDVLVDDSPVNILRALEHGIAAATIAHPWNRDVCEEEEDVVCARDWPGARRGAASPSLSGRCAA